MRCVVALVEDMLGLKYVVAKSKEFSTRLELPVVIPSNPGSKRSQDDAEAAEVPNRGRSGSVGAACGRIEGEAFLRAQDHTLQQVFTGHQNLIQSGEELSQELQKTRKRLQDQVESEHYLTQHFHHVSRVREKISVIRALIEKIADDIEDVESLLMQQTEEYMAAQNAKFAAQQQEELEKFEQRILHEKEDRKRQMLVERQKQLAEAFQNDLKTYQNLKNYHGAMSQTTHTSAGMTDIDPNASTLEAIELVVPTDEQQLEAFYQSESDNEGTSESETSPTGTGAHEASQTATDTQADTPSGIETDKPIANEEDDIASPKTENDISAV